MSGPAAARRAGGRGARRPAAWWRRPFGGPGLPAEKPKDFKGSFRRLVGTLRPEAAADRPRRRASRS